MAHDASPPSKSRWGVPRVFFGQRASSILPSSIRLATLIKTNSFVSPIFVGTFYRIWSVSVFLKLGRWLTRIFLILWFQILFFLSLYLNCYVLLILIPTVWLIYLSCFMYCWHGWFILTTALYIVLSHTIGLCIVSWFFRHIVLRYAHFSFFFWLIFLIIIDSSRSSTMYLLFLHLYCGTDKLKDNVIFF